MERFLDYVFACCDKVDAGATLVRVKMTQTQVATRHNFCPFLQTVTDAKRFAISLIVLSISAPICSKEKGRTLLTLQLERERRGLLL